MEIYLGADHRGWELKNKIGAWLQEKGHSVHDMGAEKLAEDDDYPGYAFKVAEAVAEMPHDRRGIIICGSGAGMAVAANKVPGVRAVLSHDEKMMVAARRDDDVNVLAFGADFIEFEEAQKIVGGFLKTHFEPAERHVRRVDAILQYEDKHDCSCGSGGCSGGKGASHHDGC